MRAPEAGPQSGEAIVFGMAADPIPDNAITFHDCQCAVAEAYAGRVDIVLTLQLLELQARVRRIGAE